jgi:hypothetical protein
MRKGVHTVLQFCQAAAVFPPLVLRAGNGVLSMRVRRSSFAALFLVGLFIGAAVSSAHATQKHVHKQRVPETTVEVVPPPPPPRPEQMPAVAPQVTYQNGKLTIIARNSTLGDILRAVHSKTGANVELAGSAPERVVGQFGPGPSRDVVASLLNGSHFNYVMLGSEANPDQLERLILTPKAGGGESGTPAPSQPVEAQAVPVPSQPDAPDPDASTDDFADSADADAVDQPNADDQQQGQQIGQPNAKTPEQLLLELQRQQQLQQQQQQQQQGGAPVPPQGFPPAPPGVQPQPPQ